MEWGSSRRVWLDGVFELLHAALPIPGLCQLVQSYTYGLEGVYQTVEGIKNGGATPVTLPDGRWVLASRSGCITVWGSNDTHLFSIDAINVRILAMTALCEGLIAIGYRDGSVRIWDVDTQQCVRTLTGHRDMVCDISAMSDDRLVVASYASARRIPHENRPTTAVWNYKTGELLATHRHMLYNMVPLPGDLLATCGIGCKVDVVAAMSGVHAYSLSGHCSSVTTLCVLPNGKLASGSYDCTVRVWDLETRVCEFVMEGHTSRVHSLVLLPDGKLASAGDNTVRVWDVSTGSCVMVLTGHDPQMTYLALLASGKLVVGSCYSVRIWK
jgi:WD40 repeat protein